MEPIPNKAETYQPRLSVEITEEQFLALQDLIPHGLKGQIFRVIVEDLIILLQTSKQREVIFAAVLNRLVNLPARSLEVANEPGRNPT